MGTRRFSEEDLIDCLRRLRERVGRTPIEADTHEHLDIPGHTTYVKRFGTWREALEAAGIPIDPRNMGYDKETLLAELRTIVEQLGRTPSRRDLREMGGPSGCTFAHYFGSWTAALKELGLEPNRGRRYKTEELLEILRDVAADLGHPPSVSEVMRQEELPAPRTFRYRFDTWNGALRAAGLTPRHPRRRRRDDKS
jgi:hypothetical protein